MELIVNEEYFSFTTSFYLKDRRGSQSVIIGQRDGKLVEHVLENCTYSTEIQPLLKMPFSMAQTFLKAFADYLSTKNITTENENLLNGKLIATEKHLDDMRNISTKLLDKIMQ